jgi:putative flippase GtrA
MTDMPPSPQAITPKQQPTRKPFLRFLTVGVLNTLVGLSVIYACMGWLGMSDGWANASGYAVGLCVSFTLNRRWTFAHQGAIAPAAMRFLVVAAIAYATNLATVMGCIHGLGMNSYLAQALGVPPYTLTAYGLSRLWAFRSESAP